MSLSDKHRAMLQASAISDEVIDVRGYRTVTKPDDLDHLGFAPVQARTVSEQAPGLLIPIHDVHGKTATHQIRPDVPRRIRDRPLKYECPEGSHLVLDVSPTVRDRISDPNALLWITEGTKKADAAASIGLCCLSLNGVWGWRGKNADTGVTALADWESIALKERKVYIAFDSDVTANPKVRTALARLKTFLESRGAEVFIVELAPGPGGAKIGLDDFLAAGHNAADLHALASARLPGSDRNGTDMSGQYRETPGGIVWNKQTSSGPISTPITSFAARIVRQVSEDDGAEVRTRFDIEGRCNGRAESFSIPAATYSSMNWPAEKIGSDAIIFAGFGARDHARVAIQLLSGSPPRTRVFTHTGWCEIEPGRWVYLNAGTVIGAEPGTVSVSLDGALSGYILPDPPVGDALKRAVQASLRFLELASARIVAPLYAAPWRAAVGGADFCAHVAGSTGVFKTELVALVQQHFGPAMNARHLPGAWSSTDNLLEAAAFGAKDTVFVIDDFVTVGSGVDVQRLHAKADRVLRAQGNHSARGRMRADGTLRPSKPPRGLIISTGEEVPIGQSLRARMMIVEIEPRQIALHALTACQEDASAGLYAQAMAGFLHWIAPRYPKVQEQVRSDTIRYRDAARKMAPHARTADIMGSLAAGFGVFLQFGMDTGCLTLDDADKLRTRVWSGLREAIVLQDQHQAASEPTARFVQQLRAAIACGKAHVADKDGNAPGNATSWGWRPREREYQSVYDPLGDRVGWITDDDLYLQADAAYNVARRMGADSGDGLTISVRTLCKRLREAGLLASTDDARQTLKVRRVLQGSSREVLHFRASLISGESDRPDRPDNGIAADGSLSVRTLAECRVSMSGSTGLDSRTRHADGAKPDILTLNESRDRSAVSGLSGLSGSSIIADTSSGNAFESPADDPFDDPENLQDAL